MDIVDIKALHDVDEKELKTGAVSIEQESENPLAEAIVEDAKNKIFYPMLMNFELSKPQC